MDVNVKDKVVIITGAGGGIGRATALRFAASGARVVAADRRAGRRPRPHSLLGRPRSFRHRPSLRERAIGQGPPQRHRIVSVCLPSSRRY